MTSLRKARDEGKLDQFIAEREGQSTDPDAFNRAVQAMVQKSPAVPKASSPRNPDD